MPQTDIRPDLADCRALIEGITSEAHYLASQLERHARENAADAALNSLLRRLATVCRDTHTSLGTIAWPK